MPPGSVRGRALGALRDFTRRDILLRFFADRKTRSVEDVSREAGVHRSVAFEHLERLVALGYLEVGHRRGLPGKPAKIYKLVGGPVQISHPMRRYDLVAESLARAFDELGDVGSHAVRRAGHNLGASIASTSARSAIDALLERTDLRVTVKALGFRDPYGCAYLLDENIAVEPLREQAS